MTSAQRPETRTPDGGTLSTRQRAVVELIRTAEELRRYFTEFYEPHEITSQQYNVLRILRGAHPEALPTMEIATRMLEKTPGITRLLDRLEAKALVRRERHSEDRRRVLITISAEGLALLERLEEPVRNATSAVLDELEHDDVEHLYRTLTRIRRTIAR